MKVNKETAVAICQDYGFSTADGWNEPRLAKKLTELVQLYRSGEYEPEDAEPEEVLRSLAEVVKSGEPIEFGEEEVGRRERAEADDEEEGEPVAGDEDEEEKEEAEEVEEPVVGCPLGVGDRVIVHDSEEDWKGIVHELLTSGRVMVRDRRGETWEVAVEKCEVVKRAAEVESKQMVEPSKPSKSSPEDDELRSLKERLQALRAKKKKQKKQKQETTELVSPKRLSRDGCAVKTLRSHPEGGVLGELADESDVRWQRQGKQSNLRSANEIMDRIVKVGVLFGLLKLEGKRVTWLKTE